MAIMQGSCTHILETGEFHGRNAVVSCIEAICGKGGTVAPGYNAVVGVHDIGPRCKRGALGVPISATRELLNNSDCRPLHQVQERCPSPMCLQHCPIRQHAVYGTY